MMKRRDFMYKSTLSAIALSRMNLNLQRILPKESMHDVPPQNGKMSPVSSWANKAPSNQRMNADFISYLPGVEYFLIGNGEIQGVVQYCKDSTGADEGSFFGFTIMDAEHFSQKWSTFLYSAGRGFGNTTAWLGVDGTFLGISPKSFKSVAWKYIDGVPVVSIVWSEKNCEMEEQFSVPREGPILFRRLHVRNRDTVSHKIGTGLTLYPNIALFDEVYTNAKNRTANAKGFTTLRMYCYEKKIETLGRYTIRTDQGIVEPGAETEATFAYYFNGGESLLRKNSLKSFWTGAVDYWREKNTLSTGNANLNCVWSLSRTGLKAHVAKNGKRDSGIWEYGMEWVRDDVMVMTAFLQSGFFDEAKTLFDRMFTKFVTEDGRTVESSQVFAFEFTEIDQNGELLYGTWAYLSWTGDYSTVRKYWDKIVALAELPLKPFFRQPDSGLLSNTREFWERSDSFGVKPGYELAYQFWVILGLEKAAEIAEKLGHGHHAARWRIASEQIKHAFLKNPKFRLIEDGHFIKRRTLAGEWQKTMIPPNRGNMPAGTPIAVEKTPLTEPDTSEVLPIMFEMIDPESELALKTLAWVETLWNERWSIGGYERYNSSSEPEPPGPWPFASMFVAEAYWEAGNYEKGMRVIDWLSEINGGLSGGWFEYYPEGHPSVGIVGWNWVETVRFVTDHLLGIRPMLDKLIIRPRLGGGIEKVESHVKVRKMKIDLKVSLSESESHATLNGVATEFVDGQLVLPYRSAGELAVEVNVKRT